MLLSKHEQDTINRKARNTFQACSNRLLIVYFTCMIYYGVTN